MSKDIPFGHCQLHNRYVFAGSLHLETALKIASGISTEDTDAPVIRDFGGQPYIPGSSLRGAVRSELERILAAVGKEESGLRGCVLFTDDSCDREIKKFMEKLDGDFVADADNNKKLAEHLGEKLCDICRVFGAAGYGSKISFADCRAEGAEQKKKTVIRDCVAIDRDSGAAADKLKFNYEVVEPEGMVFSFRMEAENLDEQGRRLVRLVLTLLENGLHLGGKRAAGLGLIILPDWTACGCDSPEEVWAAMLKGTPQGSDKTAVWEKETLHA